jgi:hypothetical protein
LFRAFLWNRWSQSQRRVCQIWTSYWRYHAHCCTCLSSFFLLISYASICPAKIILDRESGRSRGFGFITYTSSEEASAAITAMDGKVSSYFEGLWFICFRLSWWHYFIMSQLGYCLWPANSCKICILSINLG